MFNACLGLMLQMLNLLLQIPIDISFQTQIPLTITYCPESSIYRRWCPEQGGVSPLCKEVRASRMLSKVLGRVTHQPSEGADHSLSLAPSDNSTGSDGSWGPQHRSCSHAQSITPAHSQQLGSVGLVAGHHSVRSHTTEDSRVSGSESELSHNEGDGMGVDDDAKEKGRSRPQAMDRWHQMVRKSRNTLIPKTPLLALASFLVDTRTQTQSLTPGRKSSLSGKSSTH